MQRRRFRQKTSLEERLLREAERVKAKAGALPPGAEKDDLLRKAHQAEATARLDRWLSSSELAPPDQISRR